MNTPIKTPTITAYLKTSCGWSQGVRSIMRKYNLAYEDRDIIENPLFRTEMVERSGQSLVSRSMDTCWSMSVGTKWKPTCSRRDWRH